jgi:hypothetical protein
MFDEGAWKRLVTDSHPGAWNLYGPISIGGVWLCKSDIHARDKKNSSYGTYLGTP